MADIHSTKYIPTTKGATVEKIKREAKSWGKLAEPPVTLLVGLLTVVHFGKYSGFSIHSIEQIDRSYLLWIAQYLRGDRVTTELYQLLWEQ